MQVNPHPSTLLHIAPVAPLARVQIPMKTGPRYQTLLNVDEYKIGLPNAITVSAGAALLETMFDNEIGKKIKRRLEDLERRAGSSSASPEQSHAELAPILESKPANQRDEESLRKQRSKQESSSRNSRRSPETFSHSYPMIKTERSQSPPYQYGRELSISPPPSYGYSYSLPEPVVHAPYPQHAPFNTLPAPYPDYSGQPQYLPPIPTTLPSMPQYALGQSKNNGYLDEDILSQYDSGYTPFASMDLPLQQSYPDSNVHVNHPEYIFQF